MQSSFVLFLVLAGAFAQSPPQISDDYSAVVELTEQHGSHEQKYVGDLYEDFTGQRQRIDADFSKEKILHYEFLRFYDTHDEYEITRTKCVHKSDFNRTMYPTFSWVQNGAQKLPTTCHSYSKNKGDVWAKETDEYSAVLCVDSNDYTKPYWVQFEPANSTESRRVSFKAFKPGRPAEKQFNIPSKC